ncbi:protein-L-isoaspartate O-methyltransferase family protein [Taylorella equigenitalis]|uniref:protein-L-isoaspartate O-methyltransferase family protein n=1 Tax=Taylorella equigenitalis TaxID=29575 RepID=UPI00237C5A93|nr:protein-L-isoaspartate O-methyltransferase [Taylorella equigenitalis]WDU55093.1 protein-L-isoaspartate O-methyltransferase [Taylorella equigenitalis]
MSSLNSLLEKSRINMILQQIKPAGVLDEHVLNALLGLSREAFVAPEFVTVAYSDTSIPIVVNGEPSGEHMLTPITEARIAQSLSLLPTDTCLEIGTGSGFQAALLSRLCTEVESVEINPNIANFAMENLARNHISNVRVQIGDASSGWGTREYNAIAITGSCPKLPDALKYQLSVGGRLVGFIGTPPVIEMKLITRMSASEFDEVNLTETVIEKLHGSAFVESEFIF